MVPSQHPNYWPPPHTPTRPRFAHANSAPAPWTPTGSTSPGYLPLHVPAAQSYGQGSPQSRGRQMSAPVPPHLARKSVPVSMRNPLGTANVYIRLLPPHTRDFDLHHLGSEFGQVRSVKVHYDNNNNTSISSSDSSPTPSRRDTLADLARDTPAEGVCKGCGFILFSAREEAAVAIRVLTQRGFECSFAKGDSPSLRLRQLSDSESTNLYLANMPVEFDEAEVASLLAPWASVVSVRLLRANDALPAGERGDRGASKGIGFARVSTREQAVVVIDHLNNAMLSPNASPLKVRFADTPGQKQYKAELTAARENTTAYKYKPPISPISPRTSYFPTYPPSPTSPLGHGNNQPSPGLGHSAGQLPPRFLQERFSPPHRQSTLARAAQPVAHKPQLSPPMSGATGNANARTARIPSRQLGLQLDISPLPGSSDTVQDGDKSWQSNAGPDSPPITPERGQGSVSGGGSGSGRSKGTGELWSAGSMPRSAEPVKTTFEVEEVEGGEVTEPVAGELRRRNTAGSAKRELYASRRSLP